MNYGEVLSKAWKIIWHNKVLWIFGIMAGCSGSTGGSGNFQFRQTMQDNGELSQQIQRFIESIPVYVWVLLALGVLLLIVLGLYLGTIGRIGLVLGTVRGDDGQQKQTLGKLWGDSQPYFWRMFLLNLLVGILSLVIALIIFVPTVILTVLTAGIGVICLIPLICVLAIAVWVVSIIVEQAAAALVIENLGPIDALRRGWTVFRANLGALVVIALIISIGSFLISLVLAVPMVITLLPIMIQMMNGDPFSMTGITWASVGLLALYLPVLLVVNGIIIGYIRSVWTLCFRRLTAVSPPVSLTPASPEPPSGAAVY